MNPKNTPVSFLEGIGKVTAEQLEKIGIHTVEKLLEMSKTKDDRAFIAEKMSLPEATIFHWANMADLTRVDGIAEEYSELLSVSGVRAVQGLAQEDADSLLSRMKIYNSKRNMVRKLPTRDVVLGWIRQAGRLDEKIDTTTFFAFGEGENDKFRFSWAGVIATLLVFLLFLWLLSFLWCFGTYFSNPAKYIFAFLAIFFLLFSRFATPARVSFLLGCIFGALSLFLFLWSGNSDNCSKKINNENALAGEKVLTSEEVRMLKGSGEKILKKEVKKVNKISPVLVENNSFEVKTKKQKQIFKDIPLSHPNIKSISYFFEKKALSVREGENFSPLKTLDRAELIRMIVISKIGGLPNIKRYNNCFTDVHQEEYASYICYAKKQGWIGGYSKEDGLFRPKQKVLKAERVKMVLNAYGIQVPKNISASPYSDVDLSLWYAPHIEVAKRTGLLEEKGKKFFPERYDTRASAVEMMYRASQK